MRKLRYTKYRSDEHENIKHKIYLMCDSSTVGSTPPCQGGGRGFESRLSL